MAVKRFERRTAAILVAIAALLTPSLATAAGEEVVVAQGSPFSFNFGFSPKTHPRSEPTPVKLKLFTGFGSPTGSPHPPPASKVTVLLDRYLEFSTLGLPTCTPLQLQQKTVPKRCKRALVGRGKLEESIAFPGQEELRLRGHVLLYNARARARSTRLLMYVPFSSPVPAVLITPIDLKRVRKGRYGLKLLLSVPRIAGGAGSLVWLSLVIHRNYVFKRERRSVVTLSCPDGKVTASAKARFADGSPSVSEDGVHACRGRP